MKEIKRNKFGHVVISVFCEMCDREMGWDGIIHTNPPLYKHICPICGCTETMDDIYPKIIFNGAKNEFN